jgi:hypothetical protein
LALGYVTCGYETTAARNAAASRNVSSRKWTRPNLPPGGNCIRQILETKWEYETAHQLFIDFKKAYDSVRREVLYNILIQFGIPIKLGRLIKMCLN